MSNYMQEKAPLLPVNSEQECTRIECYKNKVYKRKYRNQTYIFIFMMIMFFVERGYYNDLKQRYEHRNDVNINNSIDTNDITLYNEEQMKRFSQPLESSGYYSCSENEPSIPFEGLSKFEYDPNQFSGLHIEQKTNSRHGAFSIGSGEAKVFEDKTVSKVTVDIDIKFNKEELQDIFWIDQTEVNDIYSLVIKADETYGGSDACVLINVIVRVPVVDSIQNFYLSLPNSQVDFGTGLSFKELSVSIANGNVEFDEINAGKSHTSVANGHVSGSFKSLDDSLSVSIANGHADISVKEIDQSKNDAIPIKVSIANGHANLQVPTDFESTFKLSSYVGRRVVESSKPQDIHRKQSGWGYTSGYYGSNSSVKNSITLSASSGSLHLNYA